MNSTMLVEPCCIDRQLPSLLRDMGGRAMMFTNGDVTVKHVFNAASSLAGPNHRMTLVVQEPDVEMMRWLRLWMQRGWTTEVRMTCSKDVRELITAELDGWTERVTLAVDDSLRSEMIAFDGERGVVVVCGPMLTRVVPGLTVYACYHGKERGMVGELLAAVEARQRSHTLSMADVRSQKEEVEERRNDGATGEATTDDTDKAGVATAQNPAKSETKSTKRSKKKGVVADTPQN